LLHVAVDFLHDIGELSGRAMLAHHMFATHALLSRDSRLIDVARLLRDLRIPLLLHLLL